MDERHEQDRSDIFSTKVRAGKRTYFFDIKTTRSADFYLTITESKKITGPDGESDFQKHKIFLYKEDMTKFLDAFQEVCLKLEQLTPGPDTQVTVHSSLTHAYNSPQGSEGQPPNSI